MGRNELEEDIRIVREVRDWLPNETQLRLDANQAWSFEQAVIFQDALKDVEIAYIEEPLNEPERLEELYTQTGIPYALDESLTDFDTLNQWPNASVLICKPTILGGRKAAERLANSGKPIVFSAAFESGVGVACIAKLAAEFSPHIAAGLDTLDWLTSDLLSRSPERKNGEFRLTHAPSVDTTALERIDL